LKVEDMSQEEQAFHFVKGLKANVKWEVEKEWVKTPGMSITQMKQLADRTDNLSGRSRTQRAYERALEVTFQGRRRCNGENEQKIRPIQDPTGDAE
jgi:hypothetical protein